jgi:hypothetical protein
LGETSTGGGGHTQGVTNMKIMDMHEFYGEGIYRCPTCDRRLTSILACKHCGEEFQPIDEMARTIEIIPIIPIDLIVSENILAIDCAAYEYDGEKCWFFPCSEHGDTLRQWNNYLNDIKYINSHGECTAAIQVTGYMGNYVNSNHLIFYNRKEWIPIKFVDDEFWGYYFSNPIDR